MTANTSSLKFCVRLPQKRRSISDEKLLENQSVKKNGVTPYTKDTKWAIPYRFLYTLGKRLKYHSKMPTVLNNFSSSIFHFSCLLGSVINVLGY